MDHKKKHPRQESNICSKTLFLYTLPLLKKGLKKELVEEDLYEVLPDFRSDVLGKQVVNEWKKQKHRKNIAMFVLFWNLFGKYYALMGCTEIIAVTLSIVRPIIMANWVSFFIPGQTELSTTDLYLYSFLLILLNFIEVIYRQNYYLLAQLLSIKLRTAMCCLIYRKSITLPLTEIEHAPFGKIENLLTRDVNSFELGFYQFNDSWVGCIIISITCYNMYWRIGLPTIIVTLVFAIFFPCLIYAGISMAKLKIATSEKTDERINIVQKILLNIRTSKMYGWEKYLEDAIIKARRKEMNILLKMVMGLFAVIVIGVVTHNFTFYLILMTCFWLGTTVNAESIYFLNSSFQSMYFTFTTAIPYSSFYAAQAFAAIKRFQETVQNLDAATTKTQFEKKSKEPKIQLKNLSLTANGKEIFKNVNIEVDEGLTLLIGSVSSGKSLFLLTLLREFAFVNDKVEIKGRVSYAPQEPWLFPSTIKNNILFGTEFNAKRYQKVIDVCALQYDFDFLDNGDETIISDHGINLSKGQQCRINLARALYKESEIYLLDDCLSNLDPIVADFIFNTCIRHFLKNKLVIFVTNDSNLTQYAENVLKIKDGSVKLVKNTSDVKERISFDCYTDYSSKVGNENLHETEVSVKTKLLDKGRKNVYGEVKKSGSVSVDNYQYYAMFGGGKIICASIIFVVMFGQISITYKDILVSQWANLEQRISSYDMKNNTNFTTEIKDLEKSRSFILYVFTAIIISMGVAILGRAFIIFTFSKNMSLNLHKKMLNSVINATMEFYDNNFIGTIVNRFSKDLLNIDECIPFTLHHLIVIVFEVAGVVFLICFGNPMFLIPTVILFICLIVLRKMYLRTGRALKRLEASTKSPIVGHLNAVLKGLPTIRAFKADKLLSEEFDNYQNVHNSASYLNITCMGAFVFAVDMLASFFTCLVMVKIVVFNRDAASGDVGLTISQTFMLSRILYYGFHKWADLETQMTSVERSVEYMQILRESKSGRRISDWPKSGEIKYENVTLSFKNRLSSVLKNVTFTINAGEKVGIVGRTGSGKSSLISVLFRLYDFDGKISIDGEDIQTLSLGFLRAKISVIPQDPFILDAPLRDNIDPEKQFSDEEIFKAIESVKLRHLFPSLDSEIISSALTFSQKQLINLAKVLIQKNKIIVFDEITENDDSETENLISGVIDEYFSSCTVIKVTHKMKFIMNCDKVIVLNNGEIVELGDPQFLLQKKGLFHKMVGISCKNSGI